MARATTAHTQLVRDVQGRWRRASEACPLLVPLKSLGRRVVACAGAGDLSNSYAITGGLAGPAAPRRRQRPGRMPSVAPRRALPSIAQRSRRVLRRVANGSRSRRSYVEAAGAWQQGRMVYAIASTSGAAIPYVLERLSCNTRAPLQEPSPCMPTLSNARLLPRSPSAAVSLRAPMPNGNQPTNITSQIPAA